MRTTTEFQKFFETELKVLLQPLEEYRIKRIKVFKKIQYFAIGFGIVAVISLTFSIMYFVLCLIAVLIVEGLAFESLGKTNRFLCKEYKYKILPKILGFINSDFEYFPKQKISKSVFEKSLLFPQQIEQVEGEDFMRFKIGDVDIMYCESKVYGLGPYSKMFNGIFISATFNKFFSSKTFVFPEKSTSFFRKLKFKTLGASYNVKLEDPEFEREFIVLSEDQVESRYILTTSLMQRILEYKKKLKTELAFSFISNRLYCTIPNSKNLFEAALFDSFMDFEFIMQSYQPLILYTGLVEDLNLNLRIWSKQ